MKFLVFTSTVHGSDSTAIIHMKEVLRHLSRKEEIIVIAQPEYQLQEIKRLKVKEIRIPNMFQNLLIIAAFYKILLAMISLIAGSIILLRNKIDLIYVRHGINSLGAIILSKIFRRTLVLEVNTLWSDEINLYSIGKITLAKSIAFILDMLSCKYSDKIISVTDGYKKAIEEKFAIHPSKIEVIPNGANIDLFKPINKSIARKKLGLNKDDKIICFVSSIYQVTPWLGMNDLIASATRVLSKVSKVKFLIIGNGPLKDHWLSMVKKLNLQNVFIFIGKVPYNLVPTYISASDICVSPFRRMIHEYRGLSPLTLYEYLACGKPVVGSRIKGIGDLLESSDTGIAVPPEDPEALGNAIAFLLKNVKTRARMAKNARQVVVTNFSWESVAQRISLLCEKASSKYGFGGKIDNISQIGRKFNRIVRDLARTLHRNRFIFMVIVWIVYALSIFTIFPQYQISRYSDPLAMVNNLFPSYYLTLIGVVSFCCLLILYSPTNESWINAMLIAQLSIILWWTPFYMSGYTRWPDTLWQMGASKFVQSVLHNISIETPALWYVKYYPGSFIIHNIWIEVTRMDALLYANIVYPAFCSIIVSLLIYSLASKLLSPRVAFFATILGMLGLHYFEVHPSPHSIGTILTLTYLSLFFTRSDRMRAIPCWLVALVLIVTHPISPLILLVFLTTWYIIGRYKDTRTPSSIIAIALGWFIWSFYYSFSIGTQISTSIYNIVTLRFIENLEMLTAITTGTSAQIYRNIEYIHLASLYSFFAIAAALFLRHVLTTIDLRVGIRKNVYRSINALGRNRTFLLVASSCFMILVNVSTIVVGGLRERFMSYTIIAIAMYIGSYIMQRQHRLTPTYHAFVKAVVMAWLLFLAIAYPLASYGGIAPSMYPPSEGEGLKFIAFHIILHGKSICMPYYNQLVFYVDPRLQYRINIFPPDILVPGGLDIIVFRKSFFFEDAIFISRSFENNTYNDLHLRVVNYSRFSKIYSVPTFEVYIRT